MLLIPQRYEFSSKSQLSINIPFYNFVVADTTKVRIFKQITTWNTVKSPDVSCCWYHKGTNFQANHNSGKASFKDVIVVADTTKVRIFKQITTWTYIWVSESTLLLIPQRYEFSSKSQRKRINSLRKPRCCWYHKGTNFKANHNSTYNLLRGYEVVFDNAKILILKLITT